MLKKIKQIFNSILIPENLFNFFEHFSDLKLKKLKTRKSQISSRATTFI
jgi:hypothetical protein